MKQIATMISFCLLFPILAFSQQNATRLYNSAKQAFEGIDRKSELKEKMGKLDSQLNAELSPDILAELFEKQEEVALEPFLEHLRSHVGGPGQTIEDLHGLFLTIDGTLRTQVLSEFYQAVELKPDYTDAYLKLAEVCLLTRREKQALEAFRKAEALQFKGLDREWIPIEGDSDLSPNRLSDPLTLRRLVYDIAVIYLRGIGHLFSVDLAFQEELNQGKIAESLRRRFATKRIPMSQTATVTVESKDKRWMITDADGDYLVRKERDKLNVYWLVRSAKGQDTTVEQILNGLFKSSPPDDRSLIIQQLIKEYQSLPEAEKAAVATILKFIQFRQQEGAADGSLDGEEEPAEQLDQKSLHLLEIVDFYIHIGQPRKAGLWLAQIDASLEGSKRDVPRTNQKIRELQAEIDDPKTTVLLNVNAPFSCGIRLLPTQGPKGAYLAISYQDDGIKLRLANEFQTYTDNTGGRLRLNPGEYICFLDVFENLSVSQILLDGTTLEELDFKKIASPEHRKSETAASYQVELGLNEPASDYTLNLKLRSKRTLWQIIGGVLVGTVGIFVPTSL